MNNSERYQRGWQKLKEVDGEVGEKIVNGLKGIAPDLGKFIIEYGFGDIYTREGLDLKSKEIAAVAALTAMGTATRQLMVHLNGALNTGSSINEIKEVILQMSCYSGFPSSVNGMNALKDVLEKRQARGITDVVGETVSGEEQLDRLALGKRELAKLDVSQVEKLEKAYNDFSPDLVKLIIEFGYGDIFARKTLAAKYRQIATIAALTAMGNSQPQLRFHINAGLNIGLSEIEIKEIMMLMTVYAGFPAAINGINVLQQVLAER